MPAHCAGGRRLCAMQTRRMSAHRVHLHRGATHARSLARVRCTVAAQPDPPTSPVRVAQGEGSKGSPAQQQPMGQPAKAAPSLGQRLVPLSGKCCSSPSHPKRLTTGCRPETFAARWLPKRASLARSEAQRPVPMSPRLKSAAHAPHPDQPSAPSSAWTPHTAAPSHPSQEPLNRNASRLARHRRAVTGAATATWSYRVGQRPDLCRPRHGRRCGAPPSSAAERVTRSQPPTANGQPCRTVASGPATPAGCSAPRTVVEKLCQSNSTRTLDSGLSIAGSPAAEGAGISGPLAPPPPLLAKS
jgi:hypothetical protein